MLAVKTTDLTKKYGKYYGIDNVDLAVEAGEVFGIVGPRGAGKTTLLRLLMNFIFPSAGSGNIFGNNIVTDATLIKETTGYVPEEVTCYPRMKAGKYIKMAMRLHGIKNNESLYNLLDAFAIPKGETFDIMDRSDIKATGIAAALAIEPRVLLLDQPTTGLTGDKRDTLFKLLAKEKAKGTTIIITAENEDELAGFCHRIATMEDGSIAYIRDISGGLEEPTPAEDEFAEDLQEYADPMADTILIDSTPTEEAIEEISIEEYLKDDEPQEEAAEEAPAEEEEPTQESDESTEASEIPTVEPAAGAIPPVVPIGVPAPSISDPVYAEAVVEDFLEKKDQEETAAEATPETEQAEKPVEIEEDTVNPKVLKAKVKNLKAQDFEKLGMAVVSKEKGKLSLAYAGDLNELAQKLKELGITDFQTKNKNIAGALGLDLPTEEPTAETAEEATAEVSQEPETTQEATPEVSENIENSDLPTAEAEETPEQTSEEKQGGEEK